MKLPYLLLALAIALAASPADAARAKKHHAAQPPAEDSAQTDGEADIVES